MNLAVFPYPGDESVYAGDYIRSNPPFRVVCLTHANNPYLSADFTAACTELGVAEHQLYNLSDSFNTTATNATLLTLLTAELGRYTYNLVLTHNKQGDLFGLRPKVVHDALRTLTLSNLYVCTPLGPTLSPDKWENKQKAMFLYGLERHRMNQLVKDALFERIIKAD